MDLIKAAKLRNQLSALSEEDRKPLQVKADYIRKHIDTQLAAMPEYDRAAAAWLVAEVLGTLNMNPGEYRDELIYSSMIAYGIAACDLLGLK